MPSAYRGRNRYRTFLKAGRIIAGRISKQKGVVGVLGTGSIGRRFGDRFSDLDLTVYARDREVRRLSEIISVGWTEYKGMAFDIPVLSYDKALRARVPSAFWTQIERWHQQNSQILFDTDGRVCRMLKQKLVYPERERKRLLKHYHQDIHEHLVFFPELWIERGRLYNVIDTLTHAVRNIVLWIYAKNGVFEPYMQKWPFYHLETGAVPEHIHLNVLTEIYTARIESVDAALAMRDKLLALCRQIGIQWEVYSFDEAHQRCVRNWSRVSAETERLLSW